MKEEIALGFVSLQGTFMVFKYDKNGLFSDLLKIVFAEDFGLRKENCYFLSKGKTIEITETLEKNGLKNGDIITIVPY